MPSNLPSSFASAAAGQNTQRDGRSNNSGEWSRASRTNGTLTFRRPSTTPSQSISSQTTSADAVQSLGTTTESAAPRRYTRDELLGIYESAPPTDVSSLFVQGWNPGHVNGSSTAARGWGKNNESHVQPQEPDLCWDSASSRIPSSLRDMTEEERELFSNDVNSPVKLPPQNKEGNALNGRKTSVSHGTSNNFSLASPSSASRPGTRRRETTDTNPYSGGGGLTSPTTATREGGSFWMRKNNENAKESMYEEPEEEDPNPREPPAGQGSSHPFAGLVRHNTTTGASGLAASSALWGQPAVTAPSTSTLGGFGNFALPGSSAIGDKRPAGGQSRLARLIPKDSNDSMAARGSEPSSAVDPRGPWRSRQRTDTDPFAGEESLSGSAVLGGAQDTSPPPMPRASLFDTPVKGSASEFGMSGLNLGSHLENEPLSPSETNPYRSPPGDRGANEESNEGAHGHNLGLAGQEHVSAFGPGGFPRVFGQAAFDGSDRSQTSSVGAKPLPQLSTLGGWPTSATPDRERNPFGNAFGNSLFSPMGDLHSPSLGNLSGVFGPASTTGLPGSGSIGRGSKLGSLFPPAMQSQMQGQDNESLADSVPDLRQLNPNPLGAIGRNAFGEPSRTTDSPIGAGRGAFADMFNPDVSRSAVTSEALSAGIAAIPQPQAFPPTSGTPFSAAQTSEPPSAQARSMVMPDRMRWVYLDPQGHQQGPFTGLEMNDWYKANFFTADLRVKRVEDPEFEPLGQLIRRIGNSREPFLVPMMGIPHGPPAQVGPFSPSTGGGIQPPLSGVFPNFGRTLTAQEQNDLERRKQEEQYLMAQQRDILSNQQRLARVQMQGHPGLHHHSSAHSLQSQPSFGSINSPATMPPPAPIGSIGGNGPFYGANAQQPTMGPISDMFREEELNLRGPGPIGSMPTQVPVGNSSMESFRARLPQTQELLEDDEGFRDRLEEFEHLRAQHEAEAEQTRAALDAQSVDESASVSSPSATQPSELAAPGKDKMKQSKNDGRAVQETELEAFNKQIEQAQASAAARSSGLPMPFPPPQSSTPLPAPAPQRVKSNLPEQYATSSRSETPEITPSSATIQPPPLAPWAKDPTSESQRGPSLKEIQEAEAKKAAKAEEAAAVARRIMAEQEAAREREKAASLASGLPTTSTWGTSSPAAATSPWTMPAATKGPAPGLTASQAAEKKKTLADIQREEELRKNKAREIAVQSGSVASAKRYADLASKPNATGAPATPGASPAAAATGAGWATVGAGGKVKVPTGPASQSRSASSSNIKPAVAAPPAARPVLKAPNTTSRNDAMDEFTKWVQGQLTRGGVAEVDIYTQTLLEFPAEASTIADVVYEISKTMNGREFANEFIRRKKLAEKGVFEKQGATDVPVQPTGGWNEVAKKNPHKEANNGNSIPSDFKVVPARKKGKK